jgi:hypothetical protein
MCGDRSFWKKIILQKIIALVVDLVDPRST